MPFLLANDSIEVLVSAGQKICVTSYGAGTAKIETATEPGNYPIAFSLLTSITNSDYTSSAFTRDTTVKITAGLCDAEYVSGVNPFPTIHRITTDSNGNILLDGNSIIEVNNSTPALRITQLGAGHALLVEDEANPDSTPFVVNNAGNVGVGVVPLSAWPVNFKAISAGSFGSLAGDNSNGFFEFLNNCYATGANTFNYSASLAATRYSQQLGKHVWYNSAVGTSGNPVSFTQAMTLDDSGNLGLGVVPSTWSAIGHKALQLPALASYSAGYDYNNNISLNAVRVSGGGWNYLRSGIPSSLYQSGQGGHRWFVAPSGTAGSTIAFGIPKMSITENGNVLICETSESVRQHGGNIRQIKLSNQQTIADSHAFLYIESSFNGDGASSIGGITCALPNARDAHLGYVAFAAEAASTNAEPKTAIVFATRSFGEQAGNERARITSAGNLLLGTQTDSSFKLDVLGSTRIMNGVLAEGMTLGADYNATTTTNATTKAGQIVAPHYLNAEEPVGVIRAFVDATSSTVSIGSGSASLNNVTAFDVYLGSSNTTTGGNIRFAIKNDGIVFTSQLAPDAVDATATLTTANLSKKIITSTTAAAVAGTLPTGTLMDGAFGTVSDLAFDWTVINTGPNTFTLSVGTGHTIVGNAAVATNTSGTFRSRRTGAATWVSYRIS